MKDIIKNSFPEENLPQGHQNRFMEKLQTQKVLKTPRRINFYKISASIAAVGLLLIGISVWFTPTTTQEDEIYAMRQEILQSNAQMLYATQQELLEIAKAKLPTKDYLEIYNMTEHLNEEFASLISLPKDMSHQEFIDCVRRNIRVNTKTYYTVRRQLAKL